MGESEQASPEPSFGETLMALPQAILRYARIENEQGKLSPTAILFYVGCVCALRQPPLGLAVLGIGWLAWQLKESREHARVLQAMDTNHDLALAKRTDEAEKLGKKFEALEKLVKEMATPERQAIAKKMAESLAAGSPLRALMGGH